MTSSSVSAQDASTDETRSPSPAVQLAGGENAISEEIQPRTGRYGEAKAGVHDSQEASAEVSRRNRKGHARQKESRMIAKRKKAYLDLFDETVRDATVGAKYGHGAKVPLLQSLVGASVWTSDEKERFLAALARYGRDNLPRLAKAIGSKSEVEVRTYLLELERGLKDDYETPRRRKGFSRGVVPAAYEVDDECEKALDSAADTLARDRELNDVEIERKQHGDYWLIDTDAAASIDAHLERQPDGDSSQNASSRLVPKTFPPESTFFDTSMLLQLSSNLFMNGPSNGWYNYRTCVVLRDQPTNSEDVSTSAEENESTQSYFPYKPSIYLSTLTELYFITKEATQKLVHAALFQATSRLRAKDATSPTPTVLASDVRIAADILGLQADWKEYWAKLPRRAGLEVYSESDKYKRGRVGTKNGIKLTYKEVEAELGLPTSPELIERKSDELPTPLHAEIESDDNASAISEDEEVDSDVSSDGIVEVKKEREQRKRKRGHSPDSFERTDERYLRALDKQADWEESVHLRELMGLNVREFDKDWDDEDPKRPKMKKKIWEDGVSGWREAVDDMAPWEMTYVRKLNEEQEDSDIGQGVTRDSASERSGSAIGNASVGDATDTEQQDQCLISSDEETNNNP